MRLRPHALLSGFTASEGSGALVLDGGPTDLRAIVDVMVAGETGYFSAEYQDGRPGYVNFRGTFDGVDTLTVDEVLLSDPSLGDPPSWGVGLKNVSRVMSERELMHSARVYHHKPLHHPVIVLQFGDSNGIGSGSTVEVMEVNPLIDDWTAKDAASFRLRVPDPSRPIDPSIVNPHTGYIEGDAGNIAWAHCDYGSRELNRPYVMIQVNAPGETSEYFEPGNAGGIELKAQWDAALAEIRTKFGDNTITFADDVLINIGGNDALQGRTEQQFTETMHRIKRAMEDPNEWGMVDRRWARYFLYDLPYLLNENEVYFNGVPRFAAQCDENVCVIGTERGRLFDRVHHTGDDNNYFGRASARVRLHEETPNPRSGPFMVRRSAVEFAAEYEWKVNSGTPPQSDGDARYNSADEELMVRKVDNQAATPHLDQLREYDRLSFIDQGNANNWEEYLLQSTPVDDGDHYTWSAILFNSNGVLAVDTVCNVVAGPGNAVGYRKRVFDGGEETAGTDLPIQSDAMAGPGDQIAYWDADGIQRRAAVDLSALNPPGPDTYEFITDSATPAIHILSPADGARTEAEFVIVAQEDSSGDTVRAEVRISFSRDGSTLTLYKEIGTILGPVDIAIDAQVLSPTIWLTMADPGAGRWSWTVSEVLRDIPYVPDP